VTRRHRVVLAVTVAVGFALRLAWILYATRRPVGLIDPTFYAAHAVDLAQGRGYRYLGLAPSAYYPPGYPFVLAAPIWVLERLGLGYQVPSVAAALNLVLGTASIVLVFDVGRRVFSDVRVGLVAAAALALWPNLVYHSALILTETVFNFLVLATLAVLLRRDWRTERVHPVRLAAGGLLIGATTLVRPVSAPFLVALFLVWLRPAGFGWKRAFAATAIVSAAAAAVVVPWTVRNLVVLHEPVLISTNLGDNLCIGNHPGASGAFELPPACFTGFDSLPRMQQELARNRELTSRGVRYLRTHPVDELRLVFWRGYYTVQHDHDGIAAAESYGADPFLSVPWRAFYESVGDAWFFGSVALAALGFARFRPAADPRRWFLIWAMVGLAVPPLIFFGDARFKRPLVPFLAIAVGVAARDFRDRRAPAVPAG
jgi:4-amino-4-deoxy-L-arabinose transferase-like glycosyltransferase